MGQARERAVWERIVAEVEAGMSQSAPTRPPRLCLPLRWSILSAEAV